MLAASADPSLAHAHYFPTNLGFMALAWREDKLIGTSLPDSEPSSLLENLRARLKQPSLAWTESAAVPAFVKSLRNRMQAHLTGQPQQFSLTEFQLDGLPPFFRRVYESCHGIPPGEVRTYGQLAAAAGSPGASRAVGQAMARNPLPLVIPCHRVVGRSAKVGGFSAPGGLNTKARLLSLENFPG